MKPTEEQILDYLNGLTEDDLLYLHKEYIEKVGYNEDEIFHNDEEFFENFFDGNVDSAVRAVCYGNYHYADHYVTFNGYANLESFNTVSDNVALDEMAEHISENFDEYNIEL